MIDAVNRVLEERERLDRGMPAAVVLSVLVHLGLAGAGFAAGLIASRQPVLQLGPMGFVVPLPPGGGGSPVAAAPAPPAPPPPTPVQSEAPPKVEPPPKVLKPPKPEPRHGLPEPDARRVTKPERVEPRPAAAGTTANATGSSIRSHGTDTRTPGIEFGPAGPGVPGGADLSGDFYLASVQRKIWMVWTQQIKPQFTQPIGVTFTILADGSVADVRVVQPSGVALLDLAAQRAVFSAAPFGPLPKDYGTNRYTIQALFRPTP